MDLRPLVGKNVEVLLYRHHKYKVYAGRLTDVNRTSICLAVGDKSVWISRPKYSHDSIKCIEV